LEETHLLSVRDHGKHQQRELLDGVSEGEEDRIGRERDVVDLHPEVDGPLNLPDDRRHPEEVGVEPTLEVPLLRRSHLELPVVDDPSLDGIDEEHSSWLQSTFGDDLGRLDEESSDLGGADHDVVRGNDVSTGSKSVSVEVGSTVSTRRESGKGGCLSFEDGMKDNRKDGKLTVRQRTGGGETKRVSFRRARKGEEAKTRRDLQQRERVRPKAPSSKQPIGRKPEGRETSARSSVSLRGAKRKRAKVLETHLLLRLHRLVVLPGLGNEKHHRLRKGENSVDDEKLQDVIESGRIGSSSLDDGVEKLELGTEVSRLEDSLSSSHPVLVSSDGVDLSVVSGPSHRF